MHNQLEVSHIPKVAVCGWSGSGKTWLLEKLIQRFSRQGYAVGVIKHDAHCLELDHPGKNTYRLWEAGTQSLLAHDEKQIFQRVRKSGETSLQELLFRVGNDTDFVLVEGHKNTPLPKLWLDHPDKPGIPEGIENVIAHMPWGDNRLDEAEKLILLNLIEQWGIRPISAGILIGGQSRRMGYPKHNMEVHGKPVLESLINAVSPYVNDTVLIGDQDEILNPKQLKVLSDIPYCEGPLAGMLSVFRWNPHTAWLILACDMPNVQSQTVEWLLSHRKMGVWGVVPSDEFHNHPLFGVYEPMSFHRFEQSWQNTQYSVTQIIKHRKIDKVSVPTQYLDHLLNCNKPEDIEKAEKP